jgi:hypothetical protein
VLPPVKSICVFGAKLNADHWFGVNKRVNIEFDTAKSAFVRS